MNPLFAVTPNGNAQHFVTWELRRLAQVDDPRLLWFLLGVGALLIVASVIWLYRRESDTMSPWLRILFPALRISAWLGARPSSLDDIFGIDIMPFRSP